MSTWYMVPSLKSVAALPDHQLLCTFDNGDLRRYDFCKHLALPMFQLLREPAFFRAVEADPHGLGAVWNDQMDIAASELWLNGTPVNPELATA